MGTQLICEAGADPSPWLATGLLLRQVPMDCAAKQSIAVQRSKPVPHRYQCTAN